MQGFKETPADKPLLMSEVPGKMAMQIDSSNNDTGPLVGYVSMVVMQ